MNILGSSELVDKKGNVKKISSDVQILFYFSASWCPPCKQFTPMLKSYYEKINESRKIIEIVFVSSDRSDMEKWNYFQGHHGNWLMMKSTEESSRLARHFSISGIPSLLTAEGRDVKSVIIAGNINYFQVDLSPVFLPMTKEQQQLILKILKNIQANPTNEKFKSVKKESPQIQKCNTGNFMEIMKSLDFQNSTDFFIWQGKTVEKLNKQISALEKISNFLTETPPQIDTKIPDTKIPSAQIESKALGIKYLDMEIFQFEADSFETVNVLVESAIEDLPKVKKYFDGNTIITNEQSFLNLPSGSTLHLIANFEDSEYSAVKPRAKIQNDRYDTAIDMMSLFESSSVHLEALKLIPLNSILNEKFNQTESVEMQILRRLFAWFKNDAFKWVDKLVCNQCGNKDTEPIGNGDLTEDERSNGLCSRVELFRCPQDDSVHRFPRYNHPSYVLKHKKGRCGEFTTGMIACLRALGFPARKVFPRDGDHVWVEIFVDGRWMHGDPCENILNDPHLYEINWGRKYSGVVAVSVEGLKDVSHRYLRNKTDASIDTREVSYGSAEDRLRRELRHEHEDEDLQFWSTCEWVDADERKEEEISGRQSGSVDWKLSRGEITKEQLKLEILKKQNELVANGMDPVNAAIEALKIIKS
jgi:peptide-N4-(N-acetyl-beta-glucosaminyl)asparagine amidase